MRLQSVKMRVLRRPQASAWHGNNRSNRRHLPRRQMHPNRYRTSFHLVLQSEGPRPAVIPETRLDQHLGCGQSWRSLQRLDHRIIGKQQVDVVINAGGPQSLLVVRAGRRGFGQNRRVCADPDNENVVAVPTHRPREIEVPRREATQVLAGFGPVQPDFRAELRFAHPQQSDLPARRHPEGSAVPEVVPVLPGNPPLLHQGGRRQQLEPDFLVQPFRRVEAVDIGEGRNRQVRQPGYRNPVPEGARLHLRLYALFHFPTPIQRNREAFAVHRNCQSQQPEGDNTAHLSYSTSNGVPDDQ